MYVSQAVNAYTLPIYSITRHLTEQCQLKSAKADISG